MEALGYALVGGGLALVVAAIVVVARGRSVSGRDGRRRDRTSEVLRRLAPELGGTYRAPSPGGNHARIELRRAGCAVTLTVAGPARDGRLHVRVLHYGADGVSTLDGPGLRPPNPEPTAVLAAIDDACAAVVSRA